jgi:hypothetical protein
MKDVIIHTECENNLCSIKPVNQSYEDKIYLTDLFESLYKLTGCIFVDLNRPNYDEELFVNRFEKHRNKITYFDSDLNNNEISFIYREKEFDRDLFLTIVEMWYEYEQPFFCFTRNAVNPNITRWMAWYDVTKKYTAYAIFRGPEQDVLWIGKSAGFSFKVVYE